jgi:hypothetical protein
VTGLDHDRHVWSACGKIATLQKPGHDELRRA